MQANFEEITVAAPSFRVYVCPGADHVILDSPDFLTETVDGIPLLRWVADLIESREVDNVGMALR